MDEVPTFTGLQGWPIVVLRRGGLGNQLFQHAAALGVSMATGGTVVYSRSDDSVRRRDLQLEDFIGTIPRASTADLARFLWPPDWLPRPLLRGYRRIRWLAHIGRPIWRPPHSYMEQVELGVWGHGLLLDGYFQTIDWFATALPRVVRQISERRPPGATLREDVLAVNMRAGNDYRRLGWCLPWEYYRAAVERIDPLRRLVVWPIADERAAVEDLQRRLAADGWRVEQPDALTGCKGRDDFWNVARARTIVVSRSTFTWWAAAVGDTLWQPGTRAVICPAQPTKSTAATVTARLAVPTRAFRSTHDC